VSTTALPAVRKSVTVNAPVERAFDVFTNGLATWWPLEQHSLGGENIERMVFEPRAGGRVYEIREDGSEGEWADVLSYDRPTSFTLAWRPYETPGERPPTELEVRFIADGDSTRVELEHRGWERLGDEAAEWQQSYDNGWAMVLGRYEAAFG
jgi:uncharacterized protein YndB with AHSA1/START domain